ncbi:MAG: YXWGXW repeat-containing protein [Acidobacteriia bacterium]|nr:YXWGXW repeat-containing protein [Terriglobia bacterium]
MRRSILALALAGFSLAACGGGYGYYYANTPPPPMRGEVVGVAPGPGYVWVNGYWGWRGNAYSWVPGYYARPPHAHAVWVSPRWDRDRGRYRFREGHWR